MKPLFLVLHAKQANAKKNRKGPRTGLAVSNLLVRWGFQRLIVRRQDVTHHGTTPVKGSLLTLRNTGEFLELQSQLEDSVQIIAWSNSFEMVITDTGLEFVGTFQHSAYLEPRLIIRVQPMKA